MDPERIDIELVGETPGPSRSAESLAVRAVGRAAGVTQSIRPGERRSLPTIRRMRAWPVVATGAAVGVGSLLLLPAYRIGFVAAVPAAVGVAAVTFLALARPRNGPALAVAVGLAGVASVTATVAALAIGYRAGTAPGLWGLIEVGALLILVAVGVRWATSAPAWLAVAAAAGGQVGWILRFIPDRSAWALIIGCALWSVGSVIAALVGAYPRFAAQRLTRTVADERATQRRQLERDLHDYVAHDLTGIVVQAQAAQFVSKDDPETLIRSLGRIERAAQRAMTTMDRALELLRDPDAEQALTPATRQPTLDDLPAAIAAFEETSTARVTATFVDGIDRVPPEISVTLYRVALEALTNIRRHAPSSTSVSAALTRDTSAGTISLSVTNDVPQAPTAEWSVSRRASGGTGLIEATARIEALGGMLMAGPMPGKWSVRATVPVDQELGER